MREQLTTGELVPLGEPDLKQEQWFEAGIAIGRQRQTSDILKKLIALKVIRTSILGDRWWVIYTENGAADITNERLFK